MFRGQKFIPSLVTLRVGVALGPPLIAQQERWEKLVKQASDLSEQRKYAEAIPVAEEALRVAEATFGRDHPNVVTSLDTLADIYNHQGKLAELEPLHKRSLAIWEKALGPDHPNIARVLQGYADLLRKMNRQAEAEQLAARAKAIREKHTEKNPPKPH